MAVPANCITEQQARQLHDNWVATREPVITQMRNGTQDTREFVFCVSELEEFLNYVKDESAKQGIDKPGVRIYFGAYNDMNSTNATVFLSATDSCDASSNNNYNVQPLNRGIGGWPPQNY